MAVSPAISGYRIERELGQGGMARVYLAIDERLERRVALKVLFPSLAEDPKTTERFLREAKTAARLNHSNIISIYDVAERGGYYFMSMEYLEAGNLRERIKATGSIEPDDAVSIVRQIASALEYAHRTGYVHRDIKPENIMFRHDGAAVLTDFGIAWTMGSETRLTKTGMSIGTPHYMSPEQARGLELDGRADVYSLGIDFYEMLTGNVPYDAQDSVAIIFKHIQEPIPELPPHLRTYQGLLNRMLAKEREARVGSSEEVARMCAEAEEQTSTTKKRTGPEQTTRRAGSSVADHRGLGKDSAENETILMKKYRIAPDFGTDRKKKRGHPLPLVGILGFVLALAIGIFLFLLIRKSGEAPLAAPGPALTVTGRTTAEVRQVVKPPSAVTPAFEKVAQVQVDSRKIQNAVLHNKEIPSQIARLQKMFIDAGMEVISWAPTAEIKQRLYSEHQEAIEVETSYDNLISLARQLAQYDKLVTFKSIHIKALAEQSPRSTVSISAILMMPYYQESNSISPREDEAGQGRLSNDIEKTLFTINDLKRKHKYFAGYLWELSARLPEWVWLNELKIEDRQMWISGKALSTNLIADYINNLELDSLPFFENVILVKSQQIVEGKNEYFQFELNGRITWEKFVHANESYLNSPQIDRDAFKDLLGRRAVSAAAIPLEDIKLVGIVKAKAKLSAIVIDPQGFPFFIKVGDKLLDGYVLAVNETVVVLRRTHRIGVPVQRPSDIVLEIREE